MPTKKLLDDIRSHEAQGYTKKQIHDHLKTKGYKEGQIKRSFTYLDHHKPRPEKFPIRDYDIDEKKLSSKAIFYRVLVILISIVIFIVILLYFVTLVS
jgi:hypothetical protein